LKLALHLKCLAFFKAAVVAAPVCLTCAQSHVRTWDPEVSTRPRIWGCETLGSFLAVFISLVPCKLTALWPQSSKAGSGCHAHLEAGLWVLGALRTRKPPRPW
jgi:hypothetical protein